MDILLVLLPFWTSLIPPLGISCLKAFLRQQGFRVNTVDANLHGQLRESYNLYFDTLRTYIPGKKQGNFYDIGNDVLRNHMMAHLHYTNENDYLKLVKILVYQTFFTSINRSQAQELQGIVRDFYKRLETYFLDLLARETPGVLGLSVFNGTLPASLFAFHLTKEKYPHIQTVMGGGVFADQLHPHSPNFDVFLEKTPYIDNIIVGEGELLFLKLLQGELPARQRVFTLEDINGEILDLANANIPDFSDFNVHHYPNLAAYVSRSCLYQCSFCSETRQWGKYRKKSAQQVVEELFRLYRHYDFQLFLLGDSLLNPIIDELSRELTKQEAVIYWDGYLRADGQVGDLDRTLLWRRSGFYRARLGVESGSHQVLLNMKKNISPQQIKDAISSLASVGIKTTTYWVVGHPGETEADFQLTLNLIKELKDDIYEAECNPFNFYTSGQINSQQWKSQSRPLYPEHAADMLIAQTWTLDCHPFREEIYERVCRFVHHCNQWGVPNPYSLIDIRKADERWKQLKKNAAPSILDFKKKNFYTDECKYVQKRLYASKTLTHDDQWGF